MRPELPYLAAGGVALVGATLRDGKLPPSLSRPAIGVVILVLVASATSKTKAAPVVHAFGMLVLLVTCMVLGQIIFDKKRVVKP